MYSQIYNNGDPYNTGLANTPFATNYTSPIIHSCIVPKLQPGTPCEPLAAAPPPAYAVLLYAGQWSISGKTSPS